MDSQHKPDRARPKVLIVDDQPENLHILSSTLAGNYHVVAARDGEKALLLARHSSPPDIVLLDIMMPGLDGYKVCRQLKADPVTSEIPVLFITALSDDQNEEAGLSLGAVDYITKPFRPALVLARVRSQLELKLHKDHLQELVEERTRELERTQQATIFTLASLAETRDSETGGHIMRTQLYMRILAQELRHYPDYACLLDDYTIEMLYRSAPLHDIGKVGVPDHILLKPGKLTDFEFEEMKNHTIYGRNALRGAVEQLGDDSFLHFAEEIAWCHHERWDGSGYPRGLVGGEIPLSGRLMAVADVYDALISRRIYKSPYSHSHACEIIHQGRGSHFDPSVVDAFSATEEQFRETALRHVDSEEERAVLLD